MKTIVWNMAQKPGNWTRLETWEELTGADIALLCEAPPAPEGVTTVGSARTEGLEIDLGPDRPVDRPWASAVVSTHPMTKITNARRARYYQRAELPFHPSRPGSWTVASVDVDGLQVTAISLYGLLDEGSDASVHRSLSELSPIFDHEDYRTRLLLGGDLNILAGPRPNDPVKARYEVVLARIEAYGLADCLRQMREPGPLEGCACGLGADCTHTWTKRIKGKATAYQDDYLFASRWLAERLTSCVALPFDDDAPSDHTPIVATFEV